MKRVKSMKRSWIAILLSAVGVCLSASANVAADNTSPKETVHTYTLPPHGTPEAYDEALAVACLQGIVNRNAPRLYVLSSSDARPEYWREKLSAPGRWLHQRRFEPLSDLDAVVRLAGDAVKGAVIWDPAVPATVNVATTIAGVEDAIAMSPDFADKHLSRWQLRVLVDLRNRFTGAETGSRKNDAYRWAIREYLAQGKCSAHWLYLYEDAFFARPTGGLGYVITRDWAVRNRAFVFDLSPWGDEVPQDDLTQPLGTDLQTYRQILEETLKQSAGKQMTELAGFFCFAKYSNVPGHVSRHEPVPTEWETVWLISPYNCYQNTVASDCYNQSFHCLAPRVPLKQRRPQATITASPDKFYVCILMADYDSATPLYQFLPAHWDDPQRGILPFAWGINPNLIETYPDIVSYLYETATPNDYFTADASAAGYMNPNRVQKEHLPLFIEHNKRFFTEADMSIAPMVLDWDQPTAEVKDAFTQFASDGFATIVMDFHGTGGQAPTPHVWQGMPVTNLINDANTFSSPQQAADIMHRFLKDKPAGAPGFAFFRIVWTGPSQVAQVLQTIRETHPETVFELVDPYTFFRLFKESHQ